MFEKKEIGSIWAEHYRKRKDNASVIILNALTSIITGHAIIQTGTDTGNYIVIRDSYLKACKVPLKEFLDVMNHKVPGL